MRPAPAAATLGIALALGLLGDGLLRADPWGANAFLWGAALAATVAAAHRWRTGHWRAPSTAALLLGAACLGAFVWRDAEFLQVWSALAFLASLVLQSAEAMGVQLPTLRVTDGALAGIESGFRMLAQPLVLVTREIPWTALVPGGPRRRWGAVTVGLLLALPVLLVFGALLRSADPVFARLTDRLLRWDVAQLVSHLVVTAGLSWLTAGYVRGLVLPDRRVATLPERTALPRLGLVQVGIPLGSLSLLLGTFAVIQAEYLFGGIATVLATAGLTVAEYARRGFFELVAIAALVLGVLWLAHSVLDHADPASRRGYRMLAVPPLVLVAIVMVSALVRLRLYVEQFGLSENRVYATAFLGWLAAVLAWFAATVLRGRADRFAFGAVLAALVTLLALTALDPQALVARTNLARAARGQELDTRYLARLGADAVPAVVAAWPALSARDRCALWERMVKRWKAEQSDWRSWNVARMRARAAAATVEDVACGPARGDAGRQVRPHGGGGRSGVPAALEALSRRRLRSALARPKSRTAPARKETLRRLG